LMLTEGWDANTVIGCAHGGTCGIRTTDVMQTFRCPVLNRE